MVFHQMATVQKDKVKNLQKADNGGKLYKILPKISNILPGEELVLKLAPGNPDKPVPLAHCGLEGGPPGKKGARSLLTLFLLACPYGIV